MYQEIVTPRQSPVVTPEQLAAFGRFDCPEQYSSLSPLTVSVDYELVQTFIEAATDQVESLAAVACLTEQVLETYDYFPGQSDPRNLLSYQLSYSYDMMPWWWFGFPSKDSIELVRRPLIPVVNESPFVGIAVNYRDPDGVMQTMSPSDYIAGFNKITLAVGSSWPQTDNRQDCIQISYWCGYGEVPARLRMAVMFLAAHFWDNRAIATIEPTSETYMTLMSLLQPFRAYRIPR